MGFLYYFIRSPQHPSAFCICLQGPLKPHRIFAFSRGIDYEKAKTIEKNPKERKLNNFLTLKNSPVLNKYNFSYNGNKLTLILDGEEIISISAEGSISIVHLSAL